MNLQSAELFLSCHRPGTRPDDARIQKAVKLAGRDDRLKTQLAGQTEFDERVLREIDELALPEGLAERMQACMPDSVRSSFQWRMLIRQPAFLAVLIALLVIGGWAIYFAWNRMQSFPGKENAAQLVEINDEMSGLELEPKSAELGNLEDWFFSKYGFEDFYVPPTFASYKTVGCRVFKQDGAPVAQIAIEKNNMICYMFHADDLGVKIAPADEWRVFIDEDWVAAIQQHEESCFMIAFRGKRAAMREFLSGLH